MGLAAGGLKRWNAAGLGQGLIRTGGGGGLKVDGVCKMVPGRLLG